MGPKGPFAEWVRRWLIYVIRVVLGWCWCVCVPLLVPSVSGPSFPLPLPPSGRSALPLGAPCLNVHNNAYFYTYLVAITWALDVHSSFLLFQLSLAAALILNHRIKIYKYIPLSSPVFHLINPFQPILSYIKKKSTIILVHKTAHAPDTEGQPPEMGKQSTLF